MTDSSVRPSGRSAADWLERGQSLEASGTAEAMAQAVDCYDHAIAALQAGVPQNAASTRQLAIAWMNRGNALQKHTHDEALLDAVRAYDQAIALFTRLVPSHDALINSTGAAWLNRGQALQKLSGEDYRLEAIASTEQAVGLLCRLPVDSNPDYRLNLAGAQTNLAQLLVESEAPDRWIRASAAIATALELTAGHEQQRAGFADIGLKARRTLCQIAGQWLIENDEPERQRKLIGSASDAVDTGMALALHWETLGVSIFRPLASRLFRFGTAFYRRHQVHFLADFVLENLDPGLTSDAFSEQPELNAIAREALEAARNDLRTIFPVVSNDADSERRLQALRNIDTALARLSAVAAPASL